jgi:hypothetical protein
MLMKHRALAHGKLASTVTSCDSCGTESAVTEDTFFIYLSSAIKMALDIMSWQTSAVMHVS